MPYSTCCGAHTTMTELDICPECRDHCDWEDDDDTLVHSELITIEYKSDDYDRPE